MNKKQKILIAAGIFLLIIAGGIFFLNNYLKREIVSGLENEYPASVLSYDDISINILAGKATIKNLRINEGVFSLETREVNLSEFNYSDYLQDDDITIGSVHLLDPEIIINKSDSAKNGSGTQGDIGDRKIRVKNFIVSGGNFRMIENDTASNTFYASLPHLRIGEMLIDKGNEGNLLPFGYETIDLQSDSLYYEMNAYHYIEAKQLSVENNNISINDFSIIPKYSREVFDQRIPYEQDWVALKIDGIKLRGLEMYKEGGQAGFTIPVTSIENANLQVYRNKMLKENSTIKPMYSEMLRELDFKLQLDEVNISGGHLEYEERVLENRPPGKLRFHNLNADIKNITNRNLNSSDFPKTRVEASALFMGESQLTFNWEFDVSNELDEFTVNGRLGSIRAEQINSFLVPSMNVEAEGNIESLYYNFYGNRNEANGDMQLSYSNFKVNILKDGGDERRSFLSGLANLILRNDRVNSSVQEENISVSRDKTKSFWNFFWLCIRDGALSTFF